MAKIRFSFFKFIFVFAAFSLSQADYGVHFVNDSLIHTALSDPGKKVSFRFTCRQDMNLIAVSYYCADAKNPPSYLVSIQEDEGGVPSGKALEAASATPKGDSWVTIPINNLSLMSGKVYHLVIEQDSMRGGQHPVGIIDENHYASVAYGGRLNSFDPRDELPDPKLNILSFEKNKWNILNRQPLYALHGSGSKFQGVSYDSYGELPIYGGGVPNDHSHDVLQGECLHPHYGFSATGFTIRIRKQGNPDKPLNCRVYSHDFMHHKTTLVFSSQALLPKQVSTSFEWVTIELSKDNRPPSFPPECRYVVFQSDSGHPVSQNPGCDDCYLLSEIGHSGGLASAADLTFDGGAHLSREATSTDGGSTWMDNFERDANVVILGPVNSSPGLVVPSPIPTPPSLLQDGLP